MAALRPRRAPETSSLQQILNESYTTLLSARRRSPAGHQISFGASTRGRDEAWLKMTNHLAGAVLCQANGKIEG